MISNKDDAPTIAFTLLILLNTMLTNFIMKNLYLFFCLLSLTGIFHACSFSTCEDAYEVRLENHSNSTEYVVVVDGKIADKIILPASTVPNVQF